MAKKKDFKEVKFILNDDDTIAFNQYYIANSKTGKRIVWRQRLIFPLFIVIYVPIMKAFKADPKVFNIGLCILIAASVIVGLLAKRIVMKQQEKAVRNASYSLDRIHAEETILQFKEEAIDAYYGGENQSIDYKSVWRLSLTDRGIYIWLNEATAMPIPNSAFSRPGEMIELFKYLIERCVNAEYDSVFEL